MYVCVRACVILFYITFLINKIKLLLTMYIQSIHITLALYIFMIFD